MQIDVASYIAPLLLENDELSLHGLGRFSSVYKAANIDSLQGVIHPPSKTLIFDEQFSEDDRKLAGIIGLKNNLSLSAASILVQDYIQSLKNELNFKKEVEIPDVGKLYLDFDGVLRFTPVQTNFNAASFGLPSLQYYPIATTNKEEKSEAIKEYLAQKEEVELEPIAPVTKVVEPIEEKVEIEPIVEKPTPVVKTPLIETPPVAPTSSSNWLWYLLALLCFCVLGYFGYRFYNQQKQKQESQNVVTTAEPVKLDSLPSTIDEGNKSQREDDVVTSKEDSYKNPNREESHNEPTTTTSENVKTETKSNDVPVTKSESIESTTEKPKKEKPTQIERSGKNCVIVVGSFSNKNNADKLVKSLKKKGMNADFSKVNGLYKVSFSFPYNSLSEIDKKLKETRLKIAQGAWVQSK